MELHAPIMDREGSFPWSSTRHVRLSLRQGRLHAGDTVYMRIHHRHHSHHPCSPHPPSAKDTWRRRIGQVTLTNGPCIPESSCCEHPHAHFPGTLLRCLTPGRPTVGTWKVNVRTCFPAWKSNESFQIWNIIQPSPCKDPQKRLVTTIVKAS